MAKAPDPITSPPPQGFQAYDAAAPSGVPDDQSSPTAVYNAAGGPGSADPWPKVREAGAIDMATGKVTGGWPGNGTSSAGPWKQALQSMTETAVRVTSFAAVAWHAQNLVSRRETLCNQPAIEVMAPGISIAENLPAVLSARTVNVVDGESSDRAAASAGRWRSGAVVYEHAQPIGGPALALICEFGLFVIRLFTITAVFVVESLAIVCAILLTVFTKAGLAPVETAIRRLVVAAKLRKLLKQAAFGTALASRVVHSRGFLPVRAWINGAANTAGPAFT